MQAKLFTLISLALLATLSKTSSQRVLNNDAEMGPRITEILDAMSQNYDKRVRPNYGDDPVEVGITIYVLSVTEISEVNMDFTLNLYFRQSWNDPRLKFTDRNGINQITVGASFLNTIWTPDTFVVNEKKSEYHLIPSPNEFIRISSNGDVLRSTRLTLTASCPMNLQNFPFDTQLCSLEIESYGYTMTDIIYTWPKGTDSVGMSDDVSLPAFRALGYKQKRVEISLTTGNYSRLAVEIEFGRSAGYYLLQTYFPAGLIVIVSGFALFLERNSGGITGRVALGITTVLTMTVISMVTHWSNPKISYLKAIDIYLGFSFLLVFLIFLESVIVGYLAKRILLKQRALQKISLSDDAEQDIIKPEDVKVLGIKPAVLDKYSRIAFPVVFILFNILYCIIY